MCTDSLRTCSYSLDSLAFFIRPQNAAIILTKREDCTRCEAFEVSSNEDLVGKRQILSCAHILDQPSTRQTV